jgi:RNA-binding protein
MLTSKERAKLSGIAQGLDPVLRFGKAGDTEGFRAALGKALDDHELVKVRFIGFKEERDEIAKDLAEATGCELVRVIGHVAVFWRRNPDPDKRKVEL